MRGRMAPGEEEITHWGELAASSHYRTASAIQERLKRGNLAEAATGLQELIEALGRTEKRELKRQLVRLMSHIIKWRMQPQKRSRSWVYSINNARDEIGDIQEDTPSLTDAVIRDLWDRCFAAARDKAEAQMNRRSTVTTLSWSEVFTERYELG